MWKLIKCPEDVEDCPCDDESEPEGDETRFHVNGPKTMIEGVIFHTASFWDDPDDTEC